VRESQFQRREISDDGPIYAEICKVPIYNKNITPEGKNIYC
jgi:hypothetical protein